MVLLFLLLSLGGAPVADSGPTGGLEALARAGQWDRVLEVAVRRGDQLPLRPEEALVAAHAAQVAGEKNAQAHFLAMIVDAPDLGAVARVELAELVLPEDPGRAVDLVVDFVRRAPSVQIRSAAVEIVETAVIAGVDPERRAAVDRAAPTIGRSSRRRIELALAVSRDPVDRNALSRLLASSTDDLVALTAAEELLGSGEVGVVDRWRIAQTFYRHGLYDRAVPILEDLDEVRHGQISQREVAFLRGRCSFRRGDWSTAALWYRKAISRTPPGNRMAELEVHLGRTYELAGEMDQAVAAAQRAVRVKTTDDRRLFLARLRLRRGELELAQAGLARLRSRSTRERGQLMVGLFELGEGHREAARARLARVRREPWRSPAAVIAAELAVADDEQAEALELLTDAAPGLDGYWAEQARAIMRQLEEDTLQRWRSSETAALHDPGERTRRRALDRSLVLEFDDERLAGLRSIAAGDVGLEGDPELPTFPPGLAARLWTLGLPASAVKWDPSGLPRETARSTWWTAAQELELGRPWLAIRVADAAWRQASSSLPEEGLPLGLRKTLYPLPFEPTLRRAATRHGVSWSLLAGVAREESRWNPTVVSKVGARGLMQLMPATAIATGSANGRPEMIPDDLFEPLISLDLGAAELGRLLLAFDGNRAAAVAAYNAGEAQARLWLEQCGEGCSEARFLAHVSFSVTRGYTEAVLGAMAAYEGLYGAAAEAVSTNEASDLTLFERPIDPAFDLVVELPFGDDPVESILDGGQRWGRLTLRLEIDRELPIGGLDLLEADADPRPQPLLGIGVGGADPKGELVDVGRVETGGVELGGEGFDAARRRQQRSADLGDVEIEAIENPRRLEIAELDLELDAGLEENGAVLGVGRARGAVDEIEKLGEIDVAAQQGGAVDHGDDLLDGLAVEGLRARQLAENQ